MKIVAISDGHGKLPDIPPCDVFIHAGDMCPATNHTRPFQANWLEKTFDPWLRQIDAKRKFVVAGNHDWIFYDAKEQVPLLDCVYLENSGGEVDGVKFWGSPWTPFFCDWAFNFHQGNPGIAQAQRTWAQIPDDVDVLITHGPPLGYGDIALYSYGESRCGCQHLLDRVMEVKPKIHIFGHIHMADMPYDRRCGEIEHLDGSRTLYFNVSVLNEDYRFKGQPAIIEI